MFVVSFQTRSRTWQPKLAGARLKRKKRVCSNGETATRTGWEFTCVKNGVHRHIQICWELSKIFWLENSLPCSPVKAGRPVLEKYIAFLVLQLQCQITGCRHRLPLLRANRGTCKSVSLLMHSQFSVFFNRTNTCTSKAVRRLSWQQKCFLHLYNFHCLNIYFAWSFYNWDGLLGLKTCCRMKEF